jgi:demethylmenaquinone methyltransferase/2-methoxy-6-polyprenyl-1,4-benzoquinol methylase
MRKRDIEIRGLKAALYDQLIFIGTVGLYQGILENAVSSMGIEKGDRILDLGAGTGKNAVLMRRYLGNEGRITALEISDGMRAQFAKKCGNYPNIRLEARSIEEPLPYRDEFDKVFLSFVIHGFPQGERASILANASRALKKGGTIHIFDWNEMDLEKEGVIFRLFMKFVECAEARDFVRWDLEAALGALGFSMIVLKHYYKKRIRLLTARKSPAASARGRDCPGSLKKAFTTPSPNRRSPRRGP